jgi:hypothetical protein
MIIQYMNQGGKGKVNAGLELGGTPGELANPSVPASRISMHDGLGSSKISPTRS